MFSVLVTVLVVSAAVLGDDAPYPPSGWRPQQQALLLLPPQISGSASNNQDDVETLDKVSENIMERLRQEVGSNTGVYHVYLPDGKLQRVQYTTAPIREGQQISGNYEQRYNTRYAANSDQQYSRYQQLDSKAKVYSIAYQPEQFREESRQYQRRQYLAPAKQQQQQNDAAESGNPSEILAQYKQEQKSAYYQQAQRSSQQKMNAEPSSYLASVHFSNVPPVTGPIYSYNPSPLVRIVRYADNYQ